MVHKRVDGDNLLYRLFLNFLEGEHAGSDVLMQHIIRSTAIWFPPKLYERYPVLLPWVIRDPKCRPHAIKGQRTEEQWGAPSAEGYLRDDNSLIKGIPKSLAIRGPKRSPVRGQRMGVGFVASHVWRDVKLEKLATRDPRLNSFVPNLVWLPRQLAKLSDREGGPFQDALKCVSIGLYRHLRVPTKIQSAVNEIWDLLPAPKHTLHMLPQELNYFETTEQFFRSRTDSAMQVLRFLESIETGSELPRRGRIPPRYYKEMQTFSRKVVEKLRHQVSSLWASTEE